MKKEYPNAGKYEKELDDLRALLQFQKEENEKLGAEKTKYFIENFQAKKTE